MRDAQIFRRTPLDDTIDHGSLLLAHRLTERVARALRTVSATRDARSVVIARDETDQFRIVRVRDRDGWILWDAAEAPLFDPGGHGLEPGECERLGVLLPPSPLDLLRGGPASAAAAQLEVDVHWWGTLRWLYLVSSGHGEYEMRLPAPARHPRGLTRGIRAVR